VTSGAVSVKEALLVGAGLALVSFMLVLSTNAPTILLSFAALAVTLVYPYAKRVVSMPQAVLGLAFSFGMPMAFSAALGGTDWSLAAIQAAVPRSAWVLLLANLFWVLAYDTEYAMVDRDDDIKIGIKTSALTLGRFDVIGVMAFYTLHLALWAAVGLHLGLGKFFLAGLLVAAAQVLRHYRLIKDRSREGCFQAFRENHWLGFAVFAGTVADLSLR
jgi:4-hydroxybenzoate polyprenyltransferase